MYAGACRDQERVLIPGPGVTGSCELPDSMLGKDSESLEEQCTLLTEILLLQICQKTLKTGYFILHICIFYFKIEIGLKGWLFLRRT